MKNKIVFFIKIFAFILSAYVIYIYGKINLTHDPFFVKKQIYNHNNNKIQIDLNQYDSLIVYNFLPTLNEFKKIEPKLYNEYKKNHKKINFYSNSFFICPFSNRTYILLIYFKNEKITFRVSDTKYKKITYYFGDEFEDIFKKLKYINNKTYTIKNNLNYYYILGS